MKLTRQTGVVFILLAFAGSAIVAAQDCNEPTFEVHQIAVRTVDYSGINTVLTYLNDRWPGSTLLDELPDYNTFLVDLPPEAPECDILVDLLANLYSYDPNDPNAAADPNHPLVWADLNHQLEASEGNTGSVYVGITADPEPMFEQQYATSMLGLSIAHSRTTGRGVAVAILDTGIAPDHPALQDRLLNGFNFVTDGPDTGDLGDGLDNDGDGLIDEMAGHGTYMAGLVRLVAPDARLLPVVVLDSDGVGDGFAIAEGIYYAISRGVEVINLSFGSEGQPQVVLDAIAQAHRYGIVVVAAAGNANLSRPEFPASSRTEVALGVAAVNDVDQKADFTNYGYDLVICAPGASEITIATSDGFDPARSVISTIPGGNYAVWEGTSMSTAFVSAAVALLRSQYAELPAVLSTADQLRGILEDSAVDIEASEPTFADRLGAGRLDIGAAVSLGPVAPTPGDLDHDGDVDLADLSKMLADYGRSVHSNADLNADGIVGLEDLAILLGNFGA